MKSFGTLQYGSQITAFFFSLTTKTITFFNTSQNTLYILLLTRYALSKKQYKFIDNESNGSGE